MRRRTQSNTPLLSFTKSHQRSSEKKKIIKNFPQHKKLTGIFKLGDCGLLSEGLEAAVAPTTSKN